MHAWQGCLDLRSGRAWVDEEKAGERRERPFSKRHRDASFFLRPRDMIAPRPGMSVMTPAEG
jgi:hypothetical protein